MNDVEGIVGLSFQELIGQEYPEWLTGEETGRAKELAQAIVGSLTQKRIMSIQDRLQVDGKSVDLQDQDVVNRITAEALLDAVNETGMLNETILRSQAHVLVWAQKAHAYLYDEASSLYEWLNTKLMGVQHPSQISDITFLVNDALPMLEKAEIGNVDELLDVPGFYSRLRESVPYFRAQHNKYLHATEQENTQIERLDKKIQVRKRRVHASSSGSKAQMKAQEEIATLENERETVEGIVIKKSKVASVEYTGEIARIIETIHDKSIQQVRIKSTLNKTSASLVGGKMILATGEVEYRIVLMPSESAYLEHKTPGIDWRMTDFGGK